VDGAGNACVTGYFYETATFGIHTLTASGESDIFVAKLGSGTPVEDELAPQAVARLHNAYPNPLNRDGSKARVAPGLFLTTFVSTSSAAFYR
jgi:hypothetical protein